MYEYGRGEYEIQRDIGMFEPSEGMAKDEKSVMDLSRAIDAFEQQSQTDSGESDGIGPMVEPRESVEDLTAGYDLLDPSVAAAARSKII